MKRVLIVRLSAIGDAVFASPMISAIKQKYPDAKISWLAEPAVKTLLEHHPDLHEVIVWDKALWKCLWKQRQFFALWREVRGLIRSLRDRQFDTALDMQGLLKSGLWVWLSGAKRRVGLGSKEGSQRLMTEVFDKGGDVTRIGSEYHYLAGNLGLNNEPFPMHVEIDEQSQAGAEQALNGTAEYMVICPFTTRPQKHWFEQYWLDLIPLLRSTFDCQIVILGGPSDVEAASKLELDGVVNLAGQTSLLEAAAIIDRARLLVGVDTGLTHMAIARNTPAVAIFGSTCPYLHSPGAQLKVIYHQRDCSPCRRKPVCGGAFDCMRDIRPEEVLRESEKLLEQL